MGSSTALKMFDIALILRGVAVSNVPRKAENPMIDISDGRNANDRMNRYGLAYFRAGAPSFNTEGQHLVGVSKHKQTPQ